MSDAKPAENPSPKKKGKLLVIAATMLLLAGGAAGATWYFMGGTHHEASAEKKEPPPKKPLYTTLETFTVNLQDPRGERFAQVGVTLQFEDADVEVKIKDHLPAIRNEILLLLSAKEIGELLTVEGKQQLAEEIREKSATAMGLKVARAARPVPPGTEKPADKPAEATTHEAKADGDDKVEKAEKAEKSEKAPKVAIVTNPIRGVLFSQFIVQ